MLRLVVAEINAILQFFRSKWHINLAKPLHINITLTTQAHWAYLHGAWPRRKTQRVTFKVKARSTVANFQLVNKKVGAWKARK